MSQEPELLIAYCGLVCTYCGMYQRGWCQGCHSEKPMNRQCEMKACALSRNYQTCADCKEYFRLKECSKLHNWIARFFGFIFRTDRIGNLQKIREIGLDEFKMQKRIQKRP